jgi:hypothetical protein
MRWDNGPRFLILVGRVRILVPSCSTLRPIERCWILRGLQCSSHGDGGQLWRRGWADLAGIDWLVRSGTKPLATSQARSGLPTTKAASARGRANEYV